MAYDHHAASRLWQQDAGSATANTIVQSPPIDMVRVTRLAILLALAGFWVCLVMVIF